MALKWMARIDNGVLCGLRSSLLLVFGAFVAVSTAADYGKVTGQKVAEGVYLFRTSPYGDVGMCGNSVAILSGDGVLVFDSGAIPETASAILSEIRKLTPKPICYLVNSHWHWDHWGGNQVFQEAFPGLQIVTHEKTREQMITVEPRWNDDGLRVQLPQYLDALERKLADFRAQSASASEISGLQELLQADRNFYDQKLKQHRTYPNVTFSDTMTLWLGTREIQIRHARGITAGDTYLYLPAEKILVTGDLMLNPYPFAIGGSYPAEWLKTLESFAVLQPALVIPGHGEARRDAGFLEGNRSLFQEAIRLVKESRAQGLTLEQTRDSIGAKAAILAGKVGIADPKSAPQFRSLFLDVFVARAYEELDHLLGDLPSGIRSSHNAPPALRAR